MADLGRLTSMLRSGRPLKMGEVKGAARLLAAEGVPDSAKRAFLIALAEKGETPDEVAGLAEVFRDLARDPGLGQVADGALDVAGTGGDRSGSFNISTMASFIACAGGVVVLKHGNRGITSRSGSSDFLASLGIAIQADTGAMRASVDQLGFCFFFAPAFHPAFKVIMPLRRQLADEGIRTVFNVIGPLINPAKPAFQLLGVFDEVWVEPIAQALDALGLKRGLVVHCRIPGGGGLDELGCCGENRAVGVGELGAVNDRWSARDLGLEHCRQEDLAGGSPEENVVLLNAILAGTAPRGLTDTVTLNAGAALWVAGKSTDLTSGIRQARDLLETGEVAAWLERAKRFYAAA